MLRAQCSIPCWRIVFSTFRDCMSFYTARVINCRPDLLRRQASQGVAMALYATGFLPSRRDRVPDDQA